MRPLELALFSAGIAGVLAMPICGVVAGHSGEALLPVSNSLSYLLVGGYAAWRRPEHRAARRMLAWGALLAIAYGWGAVYSAVVADGPIPRWGYLGLLALNVLGWLSSTAALAFLVVFPDGEYRTRIERTVVHTALILLPLVALGELLGQPAISSTDFVWGNGEAAPNPMAIAGLSGLGTAAEWAMRMISPAALLTGAAFLLVRWFRSGAADRRRIQWPLAAVALAGVLSIGLGALSTFGPELPTWLQVIVFLPVVFLVPAGLLIGMLFYDLLDLGVVIRRSALYVALWLAITAGYLLLAGIAGIVAAQRLPMAMVVATTVVVVALGAVGRHRLTALADRTVFGRRVDQAALIGDVGRRLADGSDPAEIAATLAEAARQGVRAEWASVIIGEARATAATGSTESIDADRAPSLAVPLTADGVGRVEIACGPREIGSYSARDRRVLETLARTAALAAANAALSADLAAKVADLETSRSRILRAEEAGRRRLERDLHDGVQQDLVGLLARLGLVANQLKRDPVLARRTLADAHADTRRTLEDLQELVRGIHPTLLTDRGLLAAVEERAARMPMPVIVESDYATRSARLPADVEGAAYFAVAECLTNAAKHAQARTATVRFNSEDRAMRFEVCDDGRGFDPTTARGTGLDGLRDRIEALGGKLQINSEAGHGTCVSVLMPTTGATGG